MTETKEERWKNNTLPVVSYSKVNTFKNCPKQYKFAYLDKLPRQDKPYTIFGQFCHEVLEIFHKYYIEAGTAPYHEVMHDSFIKAKSNWSAKLTQEQIQEAYQIMLNYMHLIVNENDNEKPVVTYVEKEIWLPIDNEFVLYGFIDRIQMDSDGVLHIVDYKTTKDEKYLKDRMQLLLYAYAMYMEDNNLQKIRTSYILLKHNMKFLKSEHNVFDLIDAKNKFLHSWHTIKDDKLYRATPMSWKCKMCDYIGHCKEGQDTLQQGKNYIGKTGW